MHGRGEVAVYEAPDGELRVDVRLEQDTVWLTQKQMAELFGRDRSVVTKHLRMLFQEGELPEQSNVHFLHIVGSNKPVAFYSLDVIISVGYRVKSPRGTQFRIWATRTLREHLLRGYSLNRERLAERGLEDLQQAVGLLAKTLRSRELVNAEGLALLEVVERYARTWRLLLAYDERSLAAAPDRPVAPAGSFGLTEARAAVAAIRAKLIERGEASPLFGQELRASLDASLAAVEQCFEGAPLYPSAQARAAHLLYFVIKDHPFVDGNKRIGALLFLEYLRRHGLLLRSNGQPRLADTALVAVTLLIAESVPAQKELLVRLVIGLLEDPARV